MPARNAVWTALLLHTLVLAVLAVLLRNSRGGWEGYGATLIAIGIVVLGLLVQGLVALAASFGRAQTRAAHWAGWVASLVFWSLVLTASSGGMRYEKARYRQKSRKLIARFRTEKRRRLVAVLKHLPVRSYQWIDTEEAYRIRMNSGQLLRLFQPLDGVIEIREPLPGPPAPAAAPGSR